MRGGVNLHGRTEHRPAADGDGAHIKYHAVKVEEDGFAGGDVVAVIAVKGLLDEESLTAVGDELLENALPFFGFVLAGVVKGFDEEAGGDAVLHELGVHGVVHFAGEHEVFFGGHCRVISVQDEGISMQKYRLTSVEALAMWRLFYSFAHNQC